MEEFLTKLQNISEQSNKLLLEKNVIEKRTANINENIKKYEELKQKYIEEVEQKKKQLLKNKNKHLIKCQKMEELNNKLNEILIRKQNIDDEEDKIVVLKQMEVIKQMFELLKKVQTLNDSLETTKEDYRFITEQIHNQNFTNKKTINMLNCLLKKNIANIQHREEKKEKETEKEKEKETENEKEKETENEMEKKKVNEKEQKKEIEQGQMKEIEKGQKKEIEKGQEKEKEQNDKNIQKEETKEDAEKNKEQTKNTEEIHIKKIARESVKKCEKHSIIESQKILAVIPTKEMNKSLIELFSKCHTNLPIEKQQFLFVFLMNILKRIIYKQKKIKKVKGKETRELENEKEHNDILKINEKYNNMIHQFLYQQYIASL